MKMLVLVLSGPAGALLSAVTLRACLWVLGGTPTKGFTEWTFITSCALGALAFYVTGQVLVAEETGEVPR